MLVSEQAVQAAEEAVYARHERGFLMKPLVDPIDMHAALTAALPFLQGVKVKAMEDHHDLTTHYKSWRKAMHILEQISATEEDSLYWKHELSAYDRAIPAAINALSSLSPRAQALEEAAQVAENYSDLRDIEWWLNSTKKEVSAAMCIGVAAAIRALSSHPVEDSLPQDVINLVIAAREACDSWQLAECEFKQLDKALDAFSERVPYENEPDALPASPGASE